jgi:hypothetical protein
MGFLPVILMGAYHCSIHSYTTNYIRLSTYNHLHNHIRLGAWQDSYTTHIPTRRMQHLGQNKELFGKPSQNHQDTYFLERIRK